MFLADKLSDQGIRVLKIPESCLQFFLCYESPCPLTYFGLPIHIEHPTEPCLSQGNQSALGSRHQWAQPQLKTRSIMQIPQAWGSSLYWGGGVATLQPDHQGDALGVRYLWWGPTPSQGTEVWMEVPDPQTDHWVKMSVREEATVKERKA